MIVGVRVTVAVGVAVEVEVGVKVGVPVEVAVRVGVAVAVGVSVAAKKLSRFGLWHPPRINQLMINMRTVKMNDFRFVFTNLSPSESGNRRAK